MPLVKLWVDTGFAAARHQTSVETPECWDEMSEDEKEEWMNESAVDFLHNKCECGYQLMED